MSISRLLILLVFLSASVATLAAQSSDNGDRLDVNRLVAPPEFRAHVVSLPAAVRAKIRDFKSRLPSDFSMAEDDRDCLTVRKYRVTRDDPTSDYTRLAGYSECQRADRFQVRSAVDSIEITPQ
jgi:hypothetical protein